MVQTQAFDEEENTKLTDKLQGAVVESGYELKTGHYLAALIGLGLTSSIGFVVVEESQQTAKLEDAKMSEFDKDLKSKLQEYINCFRIEMGVYLERNVGQKINVIGFREGVIVDIQHDELLANSDIFVGEVSTVVEAFNFVSKKPDQYMAGKDLENFTSKLNSETFKLIQPISFYGDGAMFIKPREEKFWTQECAKADVEKTVERLNKLPFKDIKSPQN